MFAELRFHIQPGTEDALRQHIGLLVDLLIPVS